MMHIKWVTQQRKHNIVDEYGSTLSSISYQEYIISASLLESTVDWATCNYSATVQV